MADYNKRSGKSRRMLRIKVWIRDRNRPGEGGTCECRWCGRTLLKREFTIDHVVRTCDGGGDELENLVAACAPCNNARNRESQVARRLLLEEGA